MKMKGTSLRSALGHVRGLGSAKNGTAHWWMLRLTSLALIPLSLYILGTFFSIVVFGGYDEILVWMRGPLTAVFLILFLAASFHHAANGLQEVIEDYIHGEYTKLAVLFFVRFVAVTFALLGILTVINVHFKGLLPGAIQELIHHARV